MRNQFKQIQRQIETVGDVSSQNYTIIYYRSKLSDYNVSISDSDYVVENMIKIIYVGRVTTIYYWF
jgi:GTP-dependent phosphoenolpyruvate carboxykinase